MGNFLWGTLEYMERKMEKSLPSRKWVRVGRMWVKAGRKWVRVGRKWVRAGRKQVRAGSG